VLETRVITQQLAREMEEQIPKLMVAARVPGISIALIHESKTSWHRAFGVANAATHEPVTDNTLFEAASLSKPVFAYAVLKMVDRGVLNLDSPLSDFLPEPYVNDERIRQITVRIVLDHTTGFPNWRPKGQPLKIHFSPGEKFSYSGEGYVYLQKAVEQITGEQVDEFLRETVFNPLGMSASSYVWPKHYGQLSSTGHNLAGAPVEKKKWVHANVASSLHTTALDYAKFIVAVINGIGLQPKSNRDMMIPQVNLDEERETDIDEHVTRLSSVLSWGLGWGLENFDQTQYFWHWGNNRTFRSFVIASRDTHTGMVILTNSANGLSIVDEITRIVTGRKHPAISWLSYDQYDSAGMKFISSVLRDGADNAMREYYTAIRKSNTPLPLEKDVNRWSREFLEMEKVEEALKISQWNTMLYPKSWKAYNRIAEAYLIHGDRQLAIQSLNKSLELNPNNFSTLDQLRALKKL